MAKKFNADYHYVLTANDLASGDVVFWTGSVWNPSILNAQFVEGEDGVQALEAVATKEEAANKVVGGYLVPMQSSYDKLQPVELRERRRLSGPSIDFAPETLSSEKLAA